MNQWSIKRSVAELVRILKPEIKTFDGSRVAQKITENIAFEHFGRKRIRTCHHPKQANCHEELDGVCTIWFHIK